MKDVLVVQGLVTTLMSEDGARDVLSGVSLSVGEGEIVGIVGESGCGKSMTALSVMGLLGKNGRVSADELCFDGRDLLSMTERELDTVRGNELCMVYQDALTALNPVFTVGDQVVETVRAHTSLTRAQARARAIALLERMELPDPTALMKKYPHMLSGGQRQRVMIAMALCCEPKLLIADEPTTALDVTVQAQIMRVLREQRDRTGMSVLLISHDVGLIAHMCDRVMVMYAGQIVEHATAASLFGAPAHPYTRLLLQSVPRADRKDAPLSSVSGQVPARYDRMEGCRFAPRCPHTCAGCELTQQMRPTDKVGHEVRCHVAAQEKEGAV